MAGGRGAEDAMASRFEILEEETHYPVKEETPAAEAVEAEKKEEEVEEKEEETLEAKLEKLLLVDGGKSVKNASEAKEIGNK
jgi:hypothetical protein